MAKWIEYLLKKKPADEDMLMLEDAETHNNKRVSFSGIADWLIEKMKKNNLISGALRFKGSSAYAALPGKGAAENDYYYCTDGDGTHGPGYYAWNGFSWIWIGNNDKGIDKSLKVEGAAAEAAATGEAIASLKEALVNIPIGVTDIVNSMVDSGKFEIKYRGGKYHHASKTITLGAGEYIFNLYSAVFSTDGYLIIFKEKENGNVILRPIKKCGMYNLKLEEQTVLVIVFQVSVSEDVANSEYKLYYSIYDKLSTIIPKEYTGVNEVENRVNEVENRVDAATDNIIKDLGNLLHCQKEYWTMGDIDVPITGEWSNTQVKCEVDLSNMVGSVLKVSVGSISDSVDTHRCYIDLLDDKDNSLSDNHVLENTFVNSIITPSGGYVKFDVSSFKSKVKYIKIQAQAYQGTKPTITGTIKYSDISAKDTSDKTAFVAEINETNLSNNLKDKLHISDNKGCIIKNVGDMSSGSTITVASNNIKKNKTLIVNAKINSFEKITVGHGIDVYGGAYLEVTPSELSVYNYSTQAKLVKTVSHSLTIANDIYIEVTNSVSKYGFHARIKIVSQGQSFVQSGIFDFPWTGSNGDVFIKTGTNTALSDCKVSWSCSDLSANIHAFGDSYFDYWNPKMADLGYSDRFLFDGFGGRGTLQAIAPLNFSLQHGTPKYVLWCLGMNNPDIGGVNSDWLNGFNTVILACKNKGIIPIFATIPNTPKNNNSYKNAYIKSSRYRYVDILQQTDKGAYIIAQNIITDLADIIFGN